MRKRLFAAAGLLTLLGTVVTAPLPVSANAKAAPYYLSLGDSLAQGVQPNAAGTDVVTDEGYVDDLFHHYRQRGMALREAKLGCPGETTTTMISGGICGYPHGSQLNEAVSFLLSHPVALVTIDIGANDIDGCVGPGGVDLECLADGFAAVQADLPVIMGTLRKAAPHVRIVAMNYYDPFLAAWLQGPTGQTLAKESVLLAGSFNHLLAQIFYAFGARVADVSERFRTRTFGELELYELPLNVSRICHWTYMCHPAPRGPNIHANKTGYEEIADTFAVLIGPL